MAVMPRRRETTPPVTLGPRHLRVRPRGAMVYPHVRGQARSAMTTTDDSPDVTRAHTTAARSSASPILDAFDTSAAKGGDPKEIAAKQFQCVMEQILGQTLTFF